MQRNGILYKQYSNQVSSSSANSEPVSPLQALADPRFSNICIRAEEYQTRITQQQINPNLLAHSPSTATFNSKPWSPRELPAGKTASTPSKGCLTPSWKSRLQGLLVGLAVAAITTGVSLGVLLSRPTTTASTASTAAFDGECDSFSWNTVPEIVAGNGTYGSDSYTFGYPQSIFVGSDDSLYVADCDNHRVQKFLQNSLNGTTVAGTTGVWGSNASLLSCPRAVYVNIQNKLYVADGYGITIWILGTSNSSRINSMIYPYNIYTLYVDNNGNIYYFEYYTYAIRLWIAANMSTTIVAGGNGNGYGSNQLSYVSGFTIDSSTNMIYIANSNAYTIVAWPIGATKGSIVFGKNRTSGFDNNMIGYPRDIKQDKYKNLYVLDTNNNRVMFLCKGLANTTGRTIATYPLTDSIGIALDSNLNLYVLREYPYQVQRYTRIK